MTHLKLNILSFLLLLLISNSAISQTPHECTLGCSPFPWSYKLYGTPMQTNLNSNMYANEEKQMNGYNVGFDLVGNIVRKNRFFMNISLGIAYTKYNSRQQADLTNKLWTTEYEPTIAGNQSYYLTETATNIVENQHLSFLDFPVKLGCEILITHHLLCYADIGLTYSSIINSTYDNTATLTRTGYYPDYNVLLHDIDVAGSPYYFPTNKAVTGSGSIGKQNNISAEGAFGLKYKLSYKVSIFCGAKAMYGLVNIKSNPSTLILAPSDNTMGTLMNRNDIVKTRAYGIEIGLQYNFGRCIYLSPQMQSEKGNEQVNDNNNVNNNNNNVNTNIKNNKVNTGSKHTKVNTNINNNANTNIIESENEDKTDVTELEGAVINSKTNTPIKATVVIKTNDEAINSFETDDNGQFSTDLENGRLYDVEISAQGYKLEHQTINLINKTNKVRKAISTEQNNQDVSVSGKVTDNKSNATGNSTLVVKSKGEVVKTVQTDKDGQFNVNLAKGKVYELEVSEANTTQNEAVVITNADENAVANTKARTPTKTAYSFDNINFNAGTAILTPESAKKLNTISSLLNINTKLNISISGHSDNSECKVDNRDLSNRRAMAVMNYLLNKGVKAYQMKVLSYGGTKPIASNKDYEGNAMNRRVEIKVIEQ